MNQRIIFSDKQLLASIKHGNKDAFTLLFQRYSGQFYNIAFKYTANKKDAEDIVQEVFTRVWIHRGRLNHYLPIIPYLVKIGKHLIFNQSKKRLYHTAYKKYFISSKNIEDFQTDETVFLDELENLINKEVECFPPKRKEIYKLSREQGLTTKEIASRMNITTSTVENHINKALKMLRQRLEYSCYTS